MAGMCLKRSAPAVRIHPGAWPTDPTISGADMFKSSQPCARCKVAPRNSSLKSYCIDCKRALGREAEERRKQRGVTQQHCSRCKGARTGRHPKYCRECWRAGREERLQEPCIRCGAEREKGDRTNDAYCYHCWRDWWLKRKYGITGEDYDRLLAEQGHRCKVCGRESNGRTWHVDHCHGTRKVRGILCDKCNRGLGQFNDDPAALRRAADYLEAASARWPGGVTP